MPFGMLWGLPRVVLAACFTLQQLGGWQEQQLGICQGQQLVGWQKQQLARWQGQQLVG